MKKIVCNSKSITSVINLTASKSESNRALIIGALCTDEFSIENLAIADDTQVLDEILKTYQNNAVLDVGPAGTTMRFLTSFLATRPNGNWELTGSERMQQRPIHILVNALRSLGAEISYKNKEGYPPLLISGKPLKGGKVTINGGVSSQFISSLLLIAPTLEEGLILSFEGEVISKPYIDMTISMMKYFGVPVDWKGDSIRIVSNHYNSKTINIEADWSAASYWYGIAALSSECSITLMGLKEESLQGDAELTSIYEQLGVSTLFIDGGIVLTNNNNSKKSITLDLESCPDIAQTILVSCAGLGVEVKMKGLKTLKIKETDRVAAMKTELQKLNITLDIINDEAVYLAPNQRIKQATESIATYHDHRMAMSFATLAMLFPIEIKDEEVVSKSYPNFWKDLATAGIC